jgi:hypothetical protein
MKKIGKNLYRSTIQIKSGGTTGNVTFRVWGRDDRGGAQQTIRTYPLH